jgi:hypothetical protein
VKRRTMTFLWAEDMGRERLWNLVWGLSHGPGRDERKRCRQGSQYANAVLDLRFVPTRQDLDKRLTCLSLARVFGRV